ncbi:MAG: hypothetical protein ACE144_06900 [Thermodesulfobacteriota bacterium]
MGSDSKDKGLEPSPNELKKLRGELVVILPIFMLSLYFFLGSFRYKPEARDVPLLIGLLTAIMTGMRLFHIIFPKSKIGQFREAGLAGEFDSKRKKIESEVLKDFREETEQKITFGDEVKAFIGLIGCFASFLLFGYIVGTFFAITGSYFYYRQRKIGSLLITLVSMYIIIYLLLYKLLEAPEDFGLLLDPILRSLDLI